jgi:hypothetical protein
MDSLLHSLVSIKFICSIIGAAGFGFIMLMSWKKIGATQVGLVNKYFGRSLPDDNPIAFNGEAGFQAEKLMAGWKCRLWPINSIEIHDWPQVPAGEKGFVFAQVGGKMKQGAKTADYKDAMGDFTDVDKFIKAGGQKGIQRPVLMPGAVCLVNPAAFLIITKKRIYGRPISTEYQELAKKAQLDFKVFGLKEEDFNLYKIESEIDPDTKESVDMVGVVTVIDGDAMPSGSIAFRIGGFEDVENIENGKKSGSEPTAPILSVEEQGLLGVPEVAGLLTDATLVTEAGAEIASLLPATTEKLDEVSSVEPTKKNTGGVTLQYSSRPSDVIELLIGNKNAGHNNYQNIQAFFDQGGKMGPQHDVILRGLYAFNPFCVEVRKAKMLIVKQGQVAVIKANVGLAPEDQSGEEFRFGTLVKPGHRGIWNEAFRTGKYAINPDCYFYEIVPTQIITLTWVQGVFGTHGLDKGLGPIVAKSKEGFDFTLDLQVQIHVSDVKAPIVISMVGSMANLVNEVLQAAVGNYFREKLQAMSAVDFIGKRSEVQAAAHTYIEKHLERYHVELKGVYIQNVLFPEELVSVLKEREIATQKIQTYTQEKLSETARIQRELEKGRADKQADLAKSQIGITIETNDAKAKSVKGEGIAAFNRKIGEVAGAKILAIGAAKAQSYDLQRKALGPQAVLLIQALSEIANIKVPIMPGILVNGAGGSGEGLMALGMKLLNQFTSGNGEAPIGLTEQDLAQFRQAPSEIGDAAAEEEIQAEEEIIEEEVSLEDGLATTGKEIVSATGSEIQSAATPGSPE